MKERTFFDDEFEKQLKEKSDQLKMYPSDKVWNEVHRSLHTRRNRFVAGMSFLIGGILILAGTQLIAPAKNTQHKQGVSNTTPQPETASTVDLHAFNPTAFTASPDAGNGQPSAKNPSGLLSANEFQSAVQVNTEIGAIPNADRAANIVLPAMTSGNTPSLKLKENEPAQQNPLPALADISNAVVPASEKSVPQISHIRNDRFSWEIYVSPTLNTHHLNGINYQNINPTIQSAPITVVRFANVNGFVDNTATMGYDLGGNILYKLANNFSLKAGLQFSFSRYYIKAYNSNQPQSAAVLSSYFGYIADSLANYSLARTVNPKNPQHYQNTYYQLSIPVGIEWKVAGKGRLQFHVGASIQPSYLLNRDSYVLSSDYNNYSKEPAIFRKWNFHAGAEAFISYRVGKVRWELGPMVRYQILSTYKDSYPLRENLMNYGIRLGFSKTIR